MAKVKRPASNPAYIALRSVMKGTFLDALEEQPNMLSQWPGAKLVVFGSTLMRQLHMEDGVSFPFPGRKSSDIDIGVYVPDPRADFSKKYLAHVAPTLKQTSQEIGYDVVVPALKKGQEDVKYPNNEIPTIEDKAFADDFLVAKTYSYDEAKALLQETFPEEYQSYLPHLDKLIDDNGNIDIELIISSSPVPTPTLLEPINFNNKECNGDTTPLKRDHRLNMVAAKIVRNFIEDRFKPTDLIDIYNLLHAKSDTPLFDFDPASPTNEFDDLRALIVANLAIFNCHKPWENDGIMDNFANTPENIARFHELTENNISKYGDFSDDTVKDIIDECREFVETTMKPRKDKGYGKLNLTEADVNFLTNVSGYEVLPGFSGTRVIEPWVNIDLLKEQYPTAFERHPELAQNVKHNHYLCDRMEELQYRRRQMGD